MLVCANKDFIPCPAFDHIKIFDPPQEKTIRMNKADLPFGSYNIEVWFPGERKVVKKTIIF